MQIIFFARQIIMNVHSHGAHDLRWLNISYYLTALFKRMTYLTGKVWKGAALVREGGVINNVPMKHIELTVGHCILRGKIYVNTTDDKCDQ